MTIEQILEDISSPRVKKCILDADMYNEMDDPYALGYCLTADRIELLSVNAAPFDNGRSASYAQGVIDSYNETLRVYEHCNIDIDKLPLYMGSNRKFSADDNFAPIDTPAARNIIKTVKESDEMIYVITTGTCSNIASACLLDPSIKDNMCVIWLACREIDYPECRDFNLAQDFVAGQHLFNCGVPLIWLPAAGGPESKGGTIQLYLTFEELQNSIKGDGKAQKFFRDEFPAEFLPNEDGTPKIAEWDTLPNNQFGRALWDVGAPGLLCVPEAYDLEILPTPMICDNNTFAFDKTRHKLIYMRKLDKDVVLKDAFDCINKIK